MLRAVLALLCLPLMLSGCSTLGSAVRSPLAAMSHWVPWKADHPSSATQPERAPVAADTPSPVEESPKGGLVSRLMKPLRGFHLFSHKPAPPMAQPLRRMGTIRTISADGSYVIVELEPGVMVSKGNELIVTDGAEGMVKLKVGEILSPNFIADVVSGTPRAGQTVRQ